MDCGTRNVLQNHLILFSFADLNKEGTEQNFYNIINTYSKNTIPGRSLTKIQILKKKNKYFSKDIKLKIMNNSRKENGLDRGIFFVKQKHWNVCDYHNRRDSGVCVNATRKSYHLCHF